MEGQLHKAFQNINAGSIEYLLRLRDECLLIKQCDAINKFLEKHQEWEKIARISLVKLEHIYYKNDNLYEKTKAALKNKPKELEQLYFMDQPSEKVVDDLVSLATEHLGRRFKIKATLAQCYHHAIHNRYQEAKNLIKKSKIAQMIAKQPIAIQIQYDRTIIQIGLSAFRLGNFSESNSILIDVCHSPKWKECLAQGISLYSKNQDKTVEEDIEEKKRQVPPHLYINFDMIESVYMTTSMFLEIPNISENRFVIQKKVINRNFRKLIEQYDQKGIQFVPQTSRDFIVFAARYLH